MNDSNYDFFVGYRGKDSQLRAIGIARALESLGYDVAHTDNSDHGSITRLEAAISRSGAAVFVQSKDDGDEPFPWCDSEIQLALSNLKTRPGFRILRVAPPGLTPPPGLHDSFTVEFTETDQPPAIAHRIAFRSGLKPAATPEIDQLVDRITKTIRLQGPSFVGHANLALRTILDMRLTEFEKSLRSRLFRFDIDSAHQAFAIARQVLLSLPPGQIHATVRTGLDNFWFRDGIGPSYFDLHDALAEAGWSIRRAFLTSYQLMRDHRMAVLWGVHEVMDRAAKGSVELVFLDESIKSMRDFFVASHGGKPILAIGFDVDATGTLRSVTIDLWDDDRYRHAIEQLDREVKHNKFSHLHLDEAAKVYFVDLEHARACFDANCVERRHADTYHYFDGGTDGARENWEQLSGSILRPHTEYLDTVRRRFAESVARLRHESNGRLRALVLGCTPEAIDLCTPYPDDPALSVDADVTCVDVDIGALDHMRPLLRDPKRDIRIVPGNWTCMSSYRWIDTYKDFDIVIGFDTINMLPEGVWGKYLSEVNCRLRVGGLLFQHFINLVPNSDPRPRVLLHKYMQGNPIPPEAPPDPVKEFSSYLLQYCRHFGLRSVKVAELAREFPGFGKKDPFLGVHSRIHFPTKPETVEEIAKTREFRDIKVTKCTGDADRYRDCRLLTAYRRKPTH